MIAEVELVEINDSLRRLAELQRDIQEEEILLNDNIDRLKKLSSELTDTKREEVERIDEEVLQWITEHRREFLGGEAKSQELAWGTIGIKDFPPKPRLKKGVKAGDVAKELFRAGFKQVVNVKYSIIKNALKNLNWTPERFAKFGIILTQKKNQPFYTLNQQQLTQEEK